MTLTLTFIVGTVKNLFFVWPYFHEAIGLDIFAILLFCDLPYFSIIYTLEIIGEDFFASLSSHKFTRKFDGHVKEPYEMSMALGTWPLVQLLLQYACTPMCHHVYDWNIVDCDVKQQIHLTSLRPIYPVGLSQIRQRRHINLKIWTAHHLFCIGQ